MITLRPASALLPLFLLLIVAIVESRKDVGEYWKLAMKDQDMPEEIQGLLDANIEKNFKTLKQSFDAKENNKAVKDFEPRPNVSAYGENDINTTENKGANEEFEPRPNISAYGDNNIDDEKKKKSTEDFEPRPNISAYGNNDIDDRKKNKVVENFEPRPNISAYDNNEIGAEFTEDFEPRPSVTKYNA